MWLVIDQIFLPMTDAVSAMSDRVPNIRNGCIVVTFNQIKSRFLDVDLDTCKYSGTSN